MRATLCAALAVLALAPAARAAHPQMRRAFFEALESRAHGEPGRLVEVLVRLRTAHADGPQLGTEPLPEPLEEREREVGQRAGMLMSALEIPRFGDAMESGVLAPKLDARPEVIQNLWVARCVHMRIPADKLAEMVANPGVDGVFENVELHAVPAGELGHDVHAVQAFASVQGAFDSWGHGRIKTLQARQQFNVDGTGVVIGHIDTGVDITHPALANTVLKFRDFVNGRPVCYDDDGHGTHTAGICAGRQGVGVAPGAKLVVAKALDRRGNGSLSNLLAAMQWMLEARPNLVNNSWGVRPGEARLDGMEDTMFWETLRAWRSAGIVPVFSAGNSGNNHMLLPGSYPVTLAVAASDQGDNIADFSSSGRVDWLGWAFYKPDISAPGVSVPSSFPGNKVAWISGTSMAAPHVTGVLALSMQLNPQIPMRDRERIVMDASQDIGSPGRSQRSGEGRLDAVKTLQMMKAYVPPATSPTDYAPIYMRARRFKTR